MPNVDKYLMIKLNNLVKSLKESYDEFDFNAVYKTTNNIIFAFKTVFILLIMMLYAVIRSLQRSRSKLSKVLKNLFIRLKSIQVLN